MSVWFYVHMYGSRYVPNDARKNLLLPDGPGALQRALFRTFQDLILEIDACDILEYKHNHNPTLEYYDLCKKGNITWPQECVAGINLNPNLK